MRRAARGAGEWLACLIILGIVVPACYLAVWVADLVREPKVRR